MALWFPLRVNDQTIGTCEIRRTAPLDQPGSDTICTYDVRIDAELQATVLHRYGDGAWALVLKALVSAGPDVRARIGV